MTLLSETQIRQAKPKSKTYTLKDGNGLLLLIEPNGNKRWHFRYYWQKKQQRICFGKYPTITLKTARSKRQDIRVQLLQGIDPKGAESKQANLTFAEFALRWQAFKLKTLFHKAKRRQSTAIQIERYLRKDLLPGLGHLPLTAIKQQEVLTVLRKIENRGALSISEKCRGWLNDIFRHAIAEGLLTFNPVADIDVVLLPCPPAKHNPYLKTEELPKLLNDLTQYQGDRRIALGVKLLLLTAVRPGELRHAQASDFDLDNGIWYIPPEQVKQLQKRVYTSATGTVPPYIVPLSAQAVAIVKELLSYQFSGQRYLLPHRTNLLDCISENTLNQCLRRSGYKDRLTSHGIRATISTALNEAGYPKEWIEAQLSHVDPNQVRRAYNHAEYVEQRRTMMQEWADKLDMWAQDGKAQLS